MTLIARGTEIRDLPEGFGRLLRKLRCFRVNGWETDSDGPTWPKLDREESLVSAADVVSSEILPEFGGGQHYRRRHIVALDIDWPAYLVESSTPGHHHLYIDVPGGIPHDKYMALLQALGEAGVIQDGYARVSQEREHSDLRLPWVKKTSPYGDLPEPSPAESKAIDTAIQALQVPMPMPLPPVF